MGGAEVVDRGVEAAAQRVADRHPVLVAPHVADHAHARVARRRAGRVAEPAAADRWRARRVAAVDELLEALDEVVDAFDSHRHFLVRVGYLGDLAARAALAVVRQQLLEQRKEAVDLDQVVLAGVGGIGPVAGEHVRAVDPSRLVDDDRHQAVGVTRLHVGRDLGIAEVEDVAVADRHRRPHRRP